MIITGEASGDLHGAALIREIKRMHPQTEFYGIGGARMISEGMTPQFNIKDMAFLGLTEVISHIPFILRVQKKLLKTILEQEIQTLVLIDYPGFNLNFAKKLKGKVKIYYYICPQIWAWGKRRIHKIKRRIDRALVVFPFEEKIFRDAGIPVSYVGHPLYEQIRNYQFLEREELLSRIGLRKEEEILLLLPGSRIDEIRRLLPEMVSAARKISKEFNLRPVIALSENIEESLLTKMADLSGIPFLKGFTRDLMKHSKFGIIKSGTSCLEASLIGLPEIIVYRTNFVTYQIAKRLVKLGSIGMVNLLAEKPFIEELIQEEANAESMFKAVARHLRNPLRIEDIRSNYLSINERLGSEGASNAAAAIICGTGNDN